jgi:ribonuclease VapC
VIAIDSSAVIAIFRREDDARRYAERIDRDAEPIMSAASVLECSIVARAFKVLSPDKSEQWLDGWLARAGIRIEPVTHAHLARARSAHMAFGKGTGHGAGLNFGDCFAYALAKSLDVPLLYKGGDFARTDLVSALG